MSYKHVGRIRNNKRKVVVAYRTVPNEPENCIVVTTENLMADEHDTLMNLVESDTGQSANEFAEAMARTQLPDGRNMLAGFHTTGKMVKVPTSSVEMTPDRTSTIPLNELNQMIATQRGVSIEDLALSGPTAPESPVQAPDTPVTATETVSNTQDALNTGVDTGVLTDEQIAAKYRSDALRLSKEAKRLREEAEKLSPTKKRASKDNVKNNPTPKAKKATSGSVETDI